MSRKVLIIFAKRPEPGKVKTRLASRLTPRQSADIYECFLRDLLPVVEAAGCDRRVLAHDGDGAEAYFAARTGLELWRQGEGALGERMSRATERAFCEGAERVVLIGSDCPILTPESLNEAFDSLEESAVTLGPTPDGGYYLVGLREPLPELFALKKWSTRDVLSQTLKRAASAGASHTLLTMLYDVDTGDDLARLEADLEGGKYAAPATQRFLAALKNG